MPMGQSGIVIGYTTFGFTHISILHRALNVPFLQNSCLNCM